MNVVLHTRSGRTRRIGDGAGPAVPVTVHRAPAALRNLLWNPRSGLARSYVDGDWDCDDLVALLSLLGRRVEDARPGRALATLRRLQSVRPARAQRQTPRNASTNIRAHYDLGNDLFRLMLDPTMSYSCAVWEHEAMTLEEAQEAKHRRICTKLQLGPDDHVLEIGCGWGGFAIHAAREHGARVTAVTLSPSQAEVARERVAEAGLDGRVEIRVQDYREVEGTFSRIASIEMFEAIGAAEHRRFFRSVDRLLAPRGLVCLQTIAVPDDRYERLRRRPDWIRDTIFPGSTLPSLGAIAGAVAGTALMVHDVEEIGFGYARTLRLWRENVEANLEQIRSLGYDDRFLRTWRYYLAFCEAGFAIRVLRDLQVVLTRPGNDALAPGPRRA